MTVEVSLDLLLQIVILAASIGGMWVMLKSEINSIRRQLDLHGPMVSKVDPLETRFDSFKDEVDRRLTGIERKVDEVHTLLLRAAATSAVRA